VVLDLSSAFDTINDDYPGYLINWLQHSVTITDAALSWLHSYITGHSLPENCSWMCQKM